MLYYMQMVTVNALKIRASLGSILDNVSQKGEHYVIERMGKPMAILVPYEKFDLKKNQEDERRIRMEKASKAMDDWREKYGKKYTKPNSVEIIRKMRDERTKHLLDVIEGRQ